MFRVHQQSTIFVDAVRAAHDARRIAETGLAIMQGHGAVPQHVQRIPVDEGVLAGRLGGPGLAVAEDGDDPGFIKKISYDKRSKK